MKKLLLIFGTILVFNLSSCKKEKPLEGEIETIGGKWNWVYSEKENFVCEPPIFSSIINPTTEYFNLQIEFEKEGHFFYQFSGESLEEFYIKDYSFGEFDDQNAEAPNLLYTVSIWVENISSKETIDLKGFLGEDTLVLGDHLPYADQYFNEGSSMCATYTNYFVRE